LCRAAQRSAQQARLHPRALAEVTVLHAVLAAVAPRKRAAWTLSSWALAASHLGMLEHRSSIGLAGAVTLIRANLPTFGEHRWLAAVALASDLIDGRIARRLGTVSPFGAAADSLADAAFWVWFVHRHEPSRWVRTAALLAWAMPVVSVTAASVRRGQMVDAPRSSLLRPAAALQAILTARAVRPGANRG
jgi:phosphatidylglycerophosphate synthase